jgi:hypothetical protein
MEHHGHGHGHRHTHKYHRRHHTHHHSHCKNSDPHGGGVVHTTGNTVSSNFVDVDERRKVELSFENVNVVAPPVKGKETKKKKLL